MLYLIRLLIRLLKKLTRVNERVHESAQLFYLDFVVGAMMFLFILTMFFLFIGNLSVPEDKLLSALANDANAISSSLLTTGNPPNWTPAYVSSIGLTDGSYRLNSSKVSMFMNMSHTATNFSISFNYLIFFKDKSGNVLFFDRCVFSNTGIVVRNISKTVCENFTVSNYTHLVPSERLAFYNSDIIKLVVYAWI